MKKSLEEKPLFAKSMACHSRQYRRQSISKFSASIIVLAGVLGVLAKACCATPTSQVSPQVRVLHRVGSATPHDRRRSINANNYHFLEQQNEYDSTSSGVSILDDDTVKLSLAIDDDSISDGTHSRLFGPKIHLRVSGESGMIKPKYQQGHSDTTNEVVIRASSIRRFPSFQAASQLRSKLGQGRDLHYQSTEEESLGEEEDDEAEDEGMMTDNYHHHFPYIESYREKYVKPNFGQQLSSITTTPSPPPTSQPTESTKESSSLSKSKQQEWSDIIAQVTTPSSFNEINSSASEHRLADFHLRANLPSYYYNKYHSYSEEDLENVADLEDDHSKYFVKTRPKSEAPARSNLYSNFYYEPPSFSTKSVPIPVKTSKDGVIFAAIKPTPNPEHTFASRMGEDSSRDLSEEHSGGHDFRHDEEQEPRLVSSAPAITANNSSSDRPQVVNYEKEFHAKSDSENDSDSNESILKTSATSSKGSYRNQLLLQFQYNNNPYYKTHKHNYTSKVSTESLGDVSTSQSILSKININNPFHPQLVIIKAEPLKATPGHETATSAEDYNGDSGRSEGDYGPSTEPNTVSTDAHMSSTPSSVTTTTDATSIPGIPGIDYPTLGDIPQTGFDCNKQRYKGFFADTDTKCQVSRYVFISLRRKFDLCHDNTRTICSFKSRMQYVARPS